MQEVAAEPKISLEAAMQNATAAAEGNDSGAAQAVSAEAAAEEVSEAPAAVEAEAPTAPAEDVRKATAKPVERTLRVSAHSASWLQARPDDKVVDYFLRKGESATITFRDTLTVKFGNAGGVDLELDGEAYPFDAKLGEVRTVVFD
jgi:cytoskeleton protein RodZ